jgi:hypothetical protein
VCVCVCVCVCVWVVGGESHGRQWALSSPFFCNCSRSGSSHKLGAAELLTAGPDLRTMGTLGLQCIPSQLQLSLGLLEGLPGNAGWEGSEGVL